MSTNGDGNGEENDEGRSQVDSLEGIDFQQAPRMEREQISTNEILRIMIEENRRRDELILTLVNRLTPSEQMSGTPTNTQSQPPSFHIMPDLSRTIKTFSGEDHGLEAGEWLANIGSMQVLHGWPDSFALETARSHLIQGAKCWYSTKIQEITNWQTFKRLFTNTFVGHTSATMRWQRMVERTQRRDETVSSYFHEKVKLCQDIGLDVNETKEQILVGLRSRELCGMVMGKDHYDMDALLHDLLRYDRINNTRQERFKPKTRDTIRVGSLQSDMKNTSIMQENREKNIEKDGRRLPIRNEKGQIKCFNCNNYGHLSKDCRQPKKEIDCYKCYGKGHIARNCQKQVVNAIMNKHTDAASKFIKEVKINDTILVEAMIDNGSAVCTAKADFVLQNELEIVPLEKPVILTGFGSNNETRCSEKIVSTVEIDRTAIKDIDILVVPNNAQLTDVIIGRTFTEDDDIAYVKIGDHLKFGYRWQAPFHSLQLQNDPKLMLNMAEETKLPPHSMNLINVQLEDCQMKIPTYNGSEQEMVLYKNETIGFIEGKIDVAEVKDYSEITIDMLNIDENAKKEDVQKLLCLIKEYRKCFAMNIDELGCTDLIEMTIEDDDKPVASKPYKVSANERQQIAEIVSEWKRVGIVRETQSPYASPVLLVPKKTGESRLVIDYRRLNKQTRKKAFPMPDVNDFFEGLSECKLYSTLDLAHGYLQVPLEENSKHKTAFITPDETGEFQRMIFGLTNSPYEFTRLMNLTLGTLRDKVVKCFLDDILVPAIDWEDMLKRLRLVFEAFRKAHLTLKLRKCVFGKSTVEYLGFILDSNGVKPGTKKIEAIAQFPVPQNVHEVRRFLGMTSFFRRFVPKYATIARPISNLLKKSTDFHWTEVERKAFESLKEKLTTGPVLKLFDPKLRTEVHTDASADGIAGMLIQYDKIGGAHLTYCISKKTSETESKYHSSRLELMAVVWSLQRLRNILIGIPFTVITDCQAIVYLNQNKTKNPQIARWAMMIQEFDIEIKHRSGTKMQHVDALSRAPVEDASETMEEISEKLEIWLTITEEEQVATYQKNDPAIKCIIQILEKNPSAWSKEERNIAKNYELEEGLLYRKVTRNDQLLNLYVVPKTMRKSLTIKFHDLMGHYSVDKTVQKITDRYWFAGIRRYVRKHIRMCLECMLVKIPGGRKAGKLNPIAPGKRPFEITHMDHLGPFVTSFKKNSHLLIIIDNLTKFAKLYPVPSTAAKYVIRSLKEFVNAYGLPERIITDRGTCYTSTAFEEYCTHNGIRHTLNSTSHPQANGQVERLNRTVLPVIMCEMKAKFEDKDWDKNISTVERNINNAINSTTGKSPFEALYGYNPSFHDGLLRQMIQPRQEEWQFPQRRHEQQREKIIGKQEKMKRQYDARHGHAEKLNVGQIVFMKKNPTATGTSTKTQLKYRGPLVIEAIYPHDTYKVTQLRTDIPGKIYSTTAHISQIKPYDGRESDSSSEAATDSDDGSADGSELKAETQPTTTQKEGDDAFPVLTEPEINSDDRSKVQVQTPNQRPIRRKVIPGRLNDFELF